MDLTPGRVGVRYRLWRKHGLACLRPTGRDTLPCVEGGMMGLAIPQARDRHHPNFPFQKDFEFDLKAFRLMV